MAKTHGDLILEAMISIESLKTRLEVKTDEVAYEVTRRDAMQAEIAMLRVEIAQLRAEHAATARELADWRRRTEVWLQRWWALGVTMTAAVFVALLRRFS